jgi:hypothetical protein
MAASTASAQIAFVAAAEVAERAKVNLRVEIVEPVVAEIAKKHRRGWNTGRIALWMQNLLGEPSPVAQHWFMRYVTAQLPDPHTADAAA